MKAQYDKLLSTFAFKFNLRRYTAAAKKGGGALELPPFEAVCVCLHTAWPRALPTFVFRAAGAARMPR